MDISLHRINAIQTAIELEVDVTEFRFRCADERATWNDLVTEHEARVDKDDVVWLAAA